MTDSQYRNARTTKDARATAAQGVAVLNGVQALIEHHANAPQLPGGWANVRRLSAHSATRSLPASTAGKHQQALPPATDPA